jgi:hypothetical protein
MRILNILLVGCSVLTIAAVMSGCPSNRCGSDNDCAEGRICQDGACVSSGHPVGGGTPGGPVCAPTGDACNTHGDCCNYKQGTGYCVNGVCDDSCTSDSNCLSNCCYPTEQGHYVCQPTVQCEGVCYTTGSYCSRNGDCCNYLQGTGYCVDSVCADSCVYSYECASGCCAPTTAGGACAPVYYCG